MALDPFENDIDMMEEKQSITESNQELDKRTTSIASTGYEEGETVRIKSLRGHTASVTSCYFCDNDSKMLTASHDKSLILWDFATGMNLHTYTGHTGYVTRARASPDAKRFCSGGWDKKLHVWDADTATILWTAPHAGIVTCAEFSHDGRLVLSASDLDFSIKVWDATSGELVEEIKDLHTSTPTSAQFNTKDDRIITTSMDKSTKFWDRKSQKPTLTLNGHVNIISDASCSSDERKLVTVSWDKSIAVWDISTGMYRSQGPGLIEKAHEGSISSCQMSADGSMLVTGGYDNTVALWDTENMVQKLRLQGHTDWVEDVCYSQDQKWLMSCSKDESVRLWNIEESDKIPVVLENRKSIGLKIFKCASCGKPFSLTQTDNPKDANLCVFCRLQVPDRNVPFIDSH